MKIKFNEKEIDVIDFALSEKGLWGQLGAQWQLITPYADLFDFFEKFSEQFKNHPNYLDLDKLFSQQ